MTKYLLYEGPEIVPVKLISYYDSASEALAAAFARGLKVFYIDRREYSNN